MLIEENETNYSSPWRDTEGNVQEHTHSVLNAQGMRLTWHRDGTVSVRATSRTIQELFDGAAHSAYDTGSRFADGRASTRNAEERDGLVNSCNARDRLFRRISNELRDRLDARFS